MNTRAPQANGFTLIELMVTISIAAILMMVAVPSFTSFQRNAQLTSFSNTLLASVNAARGEAMKRGRYAMVVPASGTDWNNGWVVFVDVDRSQDYDATKDVTLLTQDAPPSYLTITPNGIAAASQPYIMFDASGYARTKAGGFGASTFEIKRNDQSDLTQVRRLKIASTGQVRICTPKSSTDADCQATDG